MSLTVPTLDTVIRRNPTAGGMLDCLRDHGICVVPTFYPPEFVDPIREACRARLDEGPEDTNYPDGSYKRVESYRNTAAASNERVYHADCFTDAGRFRHDTLLAGVASSYYGAPHSVHLCLYERHRHNAVPPGGFHVDTFELSTFKIMLYLNDVAEKDGPTSYLVGTHKDAELRHLKEHVWRGAVSEGDPSEKKHPTTFTDAELGHRLQYHVKVTGPQGTIILFDTWGVHRGIQPRPDGERHILVNYYRKGANLPRSDFGFDAKADFQRYHVDYKQYRNA